MKDIDFLVMEKGTKEELKLTLAEDKGEFWFTLWGSYRGDRRFQVDFDTMTKQDLADLRTAIDLLLGI